jgi:predicted signal transduction protein with EAL and GGDEF domain
MTLIRQVWTMLLGLLLLALLGGVAAHSLMQRQVLLTQLQLRNHDRAMLLALALSQQQGDALRLQRLAAAQFDSGHYRSLRLVGSDGNPIFEREAPTRSGSAPAWFARLLPLSAAPGQAQVSDGGRPVGTLQLAGQADWAVDSLWAGSLGMAGWLALLGAVSVALAALAMHRWRRPLDAAVAQAQALEERRFVLAPEPAVPELRRLTRGMNTLVRRLQSVLEDQAARLEELRVQAHVDPLTGALQRRRFVALLQAVLGAEGQRGAGLLLVRLRDLEAMNQRIGHDAADRLLCALAQVLLSYPSHVKAAMAGRLNGSDFALYLPAAGMAEETGRSLLDALRAALATVDTEAQLSVGGAELPQPCSAQAALSLADTALAMSESAGPFALTVLPLHQGEQVPGERDWQARLLHALQPGCARLAESETRDAQGRLLHLACPMNLQLLPDGPFEPSPVWRAMAVRCKLATQLDAQALALALAAIGRDGRPRRVNLSAASLAAPEGVDGVTQQLADAGQAAVSGLWIDIAEAATLQPRRLQQAVARWRRAGARVGLEHAGARLRSLAQLHGLGLDYVRIDAASVHGAADRPAVRDLARGLVALLRGMQIQVLAEGVENQADLAALWALGFDGATGPALAAAPD